MLRITAGTIVVCASLAATGVPPQFSTENSARADSHPASLAADRLAAATHTIDDRGVDGRTGGINGPRPTAGLSIEGRANRVAVENFHPSDRQVILAQHGIGPAAGAGRTAPAHEADTEAGQRRRAGQLADEASRHFDVLMPSLAPATTDPVRPRPTRHPPTGATDIQRVDVDRQLSPLWRWMARAKSAYHTEIVRPLARDQSASAPEAPSPRLQQQQPSLIAERASPITAPTSPKPLAQEEPVARLGRVAAAWLDRAGWHYQRNVIDRLTMKVEPGSPPETPATPAAPAAPSTNRIAAAAQREIDAHQPAEEPQTRQPRAAESGPATPPALAPRDLQKRVFAWLNHADASYQAEIVQALSHPQPAAPRPSADATPSLPSDTASHDWPILDGASGSTTPTTTARSPAARVARSAERVTRTKPAATTARQASRTNGSEPARPHPEQPARKPSAAAPRSIAKPAGAGLGGEPIVISQHPPRQERALAVPDVAKHLARARRAQVAASIARAKAERRAAAARHAAQAAQARLKRLIQARLAAEAERDAARRLHAAERAKAAASRRAAEQAQAVAAHRVTEAKRARQRAAAAARRLATPRDRQQARRNAAAAEAQQKAAQPLQLGRKRANGTSGARAADTDRRRGDQQPSAPAQLRRRAASNPTPAARGTDRHEKSPAPTLSSGAAPQPRPAPPSQTVKVPDGRASKSSSRSPSDAGAATSRKPTTPSTKVKSYRRTVRKARDTHAARMRRRWIACGLGRSRRSSRGRLHVVGPGETLWRIAKRYYGNGARYRRLIRANRSRLRNPRKLRPCQVIAVPRR